jgi:hypothetical protein
MSIWSILLGESCWMSIWSILLGESCWMSIWSILLGELCRVFLISSISTHLFGVSNSILVPLSLAASNLLVALPAELPCALPVCEAEAIDVRRDLAAATSSCRALLFSCNSLTALVNFSISSFLLLASDDLVGVEDGGLDSTTIGASLEPGGIRWI